MGSLTIPARFNGPPASGNGGYVAGSLARLLGLPVVDVSLRAPPPLDRPLTVRQADPQPGGQAAGQAGALSIVLLDGDTELARASAGELSVDLPPAPDHDAACAAGALGRLRAASRSSPYARCFGCGIQRHDGLQLLPGPVGDDGVVATGWTPAASLADGDGRIGIEIIWTALDCPAGFAWSNRLPDASPMMTARMIARIVAPISAGEQLVVAAWPIAQEGRKLHAGTAIFGRDGGVRAYSRQLWLLPRG